MDSSVVFDNDVTTLSSKQRHGGPPATKMGLVGVGVNAICTQMRALRAISLASAFELACTRSLVVSTFV